MAQRSTRNKVRLQAFEAFADLKRAQTHLVQLAALANEQSDHINRDLPIIIAALDMVIDSTEKFAEAL